MQLFYCGHELSHPKNVVLNLTSHVCKMFISFTFHTLYLCIAYPYLVIVIGIRQLYVSRLLLLSENGDHTTSTEMAYCQLDRVDAGIVNHVHCP